MAECSERKESSISWYGTSVENFLLPMQLWKTFLGYFPLHWRGFSKLILSSAWNAMLFGSGSLSPSLQALFEHHIVWVCVVGLQRPVMIWSFLVACVRFPGSQLAVPAVKKELSSGLFLHPRSFTVCSACRFRHVHGGFGSWRKS